MQKAYSYEAIKIELLDYMKKENRVVDGQNRATETAPRISTNSISVAKLLKDVEKSYVKGEKLLNVSQVLTEDGIFFFTWFLFSPQKIIADLIADFVDDFITWETAKAELYHEN